MVGRGRSPTRRAHGVLVLLLALPSLPAWGWGATGHRVVGALAESLLDAPTRARLEAVTGGQGLGELGLWLDENRDSLKLSLPGSERWHYDNRPDCGARVPLESYCADGACASAAYAKYRAILADHRSPAAERLFALRVVVHVLADIHQPLHAADNADRGGNRLEVSVGRRRHPKSLHAAWDIDFVKRAMHGERPEGFVRELGADRERARARLEAGDFADWARESWQLAHDYAYGQLPGFACGVEEPRAERLPAEYSDGAARIVREQLARAGFRLAAELRATL